VGLDQAGFGYTHIFSPTVYNDFRLTFVQEINYTEPGGPPVPQLGPTRVPLSKFPDIDTSNYIGLGASSAFHDRDRSWVFSQALQIREGGETV
jgi:hypothetical protein